MDHLPSIALPLAHHFRAQAIPALRRVVRIHVVRIVEGRETPEIAARATWRIADRLGAVHFSEPWRQHLDEWIHLELAREIAAEHARLVPEVRL